MRIKKNEYECPACEYTESQSQEKKDD